MSHKKISSLLSRLQKVWTSRRAGVMLVGISAVTAGCLFLWIPSPGVSAALIGVVAVVVSLRTTATGTEKAVWVLLLLAFLAIELRAIKKDRFELAAEHARQLDEERKLFNEITQSMKSGFEESINAATGGDGYCYLDAKPTAASILVVCPGKYPVYDLGLHVFDENTQKMASEIKVGDMPARRFKGFASPLQFSGVNKQNFTIVFEARNGIWKELMRFRKVRDAWVSAKLVYRIPDRPLAKGLFLAKFVDTAFPMDELKGDNEWTMAENLPHLEDLKKSSP